MAGGTEGSPPARSGSCVPLGDVRGSSAPALGHPPPPLPRFQNVLPIQPDLPLHSPVFPLPPFFLEMPFRKNESLFLNPAPGGRQAARAARGLQGGGLGEGKGANWLCFLLIIPSGDTTHRFPVRSSRLCTTGRGQRGGGADLLRGRASTLSPDPPALPHQACGLQGRERAPGRWAYTPTSPATRAPSLSH